MSSPESSGGADERNLTIIVIPDGELDSRSYIISYGKLKALVVLGGVLLLGFALGAAFLFPMLAQGTQVPALKRQLEKLESERAEVVDLAQRLQEVEAQYERVRRMLGADAVTSGDSSSVLPPLRIDTTTTSLDSGARDSAAAIDYGPLQVRGFITRSVTDARATHTGLDIAVPASSHIYAAGPGTVRAAGVDSIYGQYVVIDHGGGLESVYGHASRLYVTAGDRVRRAEVIGLTGSTGRSTAPHLHFEIRRSGKVVDPLAFVRMP
jgi:murein DD-endopeptidase MepM/ murein hydrolase activator NlpD